MSKWWEILELPTDVVTAEEIEKKYRAIAKNRHPDMGGSHEAMVELNTAHESALIWVKTETQRLEYEKRARLEQSRWNAAYAQQALAAQFSYANQLNQSMCNQALGGMGGLGSMMGQMIGTAAGQVPPKSEARTSADWFRFWRGIK